MPDKKQLTGIILAGGKSRRMGTDKGLLLYRGQPLVKYAIDLLINFCNTIIISTNRQEYEQFGFTMVADRYLDAGPKSGLASCMQNSKTPYNLVLSCDMPLIPLIVAEKIISLADEAKIIVPHDERGLPQPLCAIYHSDTLGSMLQQLEEGNFRMTDLFLPEITRFVETHEYSIPFDSRWFRNINQPDDLHDELTN